MQPEIFVVGAARTAIGSFGGSLKDAALTHLGTTAVRAALERSKWGIQLNTVTRIAKGDLARRYPVKKALYCEV
jgi:acetyl-CoA C-acetyltransferase